MVLDLETEIPKFRKGGALDHSGEYQKMSIPSNLYKTDTQTARQYLKEKAKSELRLNPKLRHSFGLTTLPPKVEDLRNMVGRADVACQTDDNLVRHNFPNLTQYQSWSSNKVEPFFRVLETLPLYVINLKFAFLYRTWRKHWNLIDRLISLPIASHTAMQLRVGTLNHPQGKRNEWQVVIKVNISLHWKWFHPCHTKALLDIRKMWFI